MSDELKKVEYGLVDPKKTALVIEKTPKEHVKYRQGRGSMQLAYVETGYMIDRLNKIFNYMWSFEIMEKSQNQSLTQVQVRGRLTGYIVIPSSPPIVQPIVKEQYGSAEIKQFSTGHPKAGTPMDIGDDFKSAASDALKKCASMLGIAADLYWKGSADEAKGEGESVFPPVK